MEPTCLYLKAYTREQLAEILVHYAPITTPRYARFVDLLLTVCMPVTRNVNELLYLAQVRCLIVIPPYLRLVLTFFHVLLQFNWKAFDEPVAKGLVSADDEWAQYKYALPTLKRSLSTIYLRPELNSTGGGAEASKLSTGPTVGAAANHANGNNNALELPLYSRYLLVAAYIASYNPKVADKRFLVKVSLAFGISCPFYLL